LAGFKGGLPFVSLFNADIVEFPADIKLGEELFTRKVMNQL